MSPQQRPVVPVAICVCLLALAGPPSARAQTDATLRGRVVAEADGSQVAGASVVLDAGGTGPSRRVVADDDGWFAIPDVAPGEHGLTASAVGFDAREVRVVLEPREVASVRVALRIAGVAVRVDVAGDAAVVAGTHSPSSTVLSAARLEALPAARRHGLPDAIVAAAPGMIRGHDDFVHVRGHEVALNPIIDGVSFWENPHTLFSSGLGADVVESANVMTGGFSAEYGNRFGGVIDIVTKSGATMRDTGSVALTGGQAGRHSASADVGGVRRGLGYYAFGSVFTSERFLSPPDVGAIHDSGTGGHAPVRLDARIGTAGALRALVMGDGASFEIPTTPLDEALRPLAKANQRTRQQTAIAGWSRAGAGTLLSASVYQRWSGVRLLPAAGPLTAPTSTGRC